MDWKKTQEESLEFFKKTFEMLEISEKDFTIKYLTEIKGSKYVTIYKSEFRKKRLYIEIVTHEGPLKNRELLSWKPGEMTSYEKHPSNNELYLVPFSEFNLISTDSEVKKINVEPEFDKMKVSDMHPLDFLAIMYKEPVAKNDKINMIIKNLKNKD